MLDEKDNNVLIPIERYEQAVQDDQFLEFIYNAYVATEKNNPYKTALKTPLDIVLEIVFGPVENEVAEADQDDDDG